MAKKSFFDFIAGLDIKQSAKQMGDDVEGLKKILSPKIKSLNLKANLDTSSFEKLGKYLDGQVISAKALKEILESISVLENKRIAEKSQKDRIKKITMTGVSSDLTPAQQQGIEATQTALLSAMPDAKEITVKSIAIDAYTGAIKSVTLAVKDFDSVIKKAVVTLNGGEALISSITVMENFESQIKAGTAELNKMYNELANIEKMKARGEVSSDEIQTLQLAKEAQIREKILELQEATVKTAKQSLIDAKQEEMTLAKIEKQKAEGLRRVETAGITAQGGVDSKEAGRAVGQYLSKSKEILQLQIKMKFENEESAKITQRRIDQLKQENVSLNALISNFKNAAAARDRGMEDLSQREGTLIAAEELKQGNIYLKNIKKTYSEILQVSEEIGKAEGKEETQKVEGLRAQLNTLNELKATQQSFIMEQIKDADVKAKFQKDFLELQEREIQGINAINIATEQVKQKERERLENKYGQETIPVTDYLRTEEGLKSYAKEFIHTDAVLRGSLNPALKENGKITQMATAEYHVAKGMVQRYGISIDEVTGKMRLLNMGQHTVHDAMKTLSDRIFITTQRLMAYVSASTLVYGAVRKFGEGIQFVSELDKELTQTAVTLNLTREGSQALAHDYNKLAIQMGKTTLEIAKANTELVRQGLTVKESEKRLQSVMKLSAVGAISTAEALKVITSGVNALKVSANELSDVLVYAGQLSASSVEELGEAFQKVASSAFSSNLGLKETTSILATMTEVTQEEAGSIGTALKTIIARFNNVNEETGELEGSINKVESAFKSIGVAFTDSGGQIRDVFSILEDASEVWDTLDKNTKSYIATQAAGTRQQNKFFSIMDNFNRVLELNNQLTDSAGKLQQGYAVYLESTEAKANQAKAAIEKLWINTISPDVLSFFHNLTRIVASLVDNFGFFGTIASGIGVHLFTVGETLTHWKSKTELVGKAVKKIDNGYSGIFQTMVKIARSSDEELKQYQEKLVKKQLIAVAENQALSRTALNLKLIGATVVKTAAVAAATTFIPVAIGLAIGALTKYFKKLEEVRLKNIDMGNQISNSFQNAGSEIQNNLNKLEEYNELKQKIVDTTGSARTSLNQDDFSRFNELTKELKTLLPEVTSYTDAYGSEILQVETSYEAATKATEDFIQKQWEAFRGDPGQFEPWKKHIEEVGAQQDKLYEARKRKESELAELQRKQSLGITTVSTIATEGNSDHGIRREVETIEETIARTAQELERLDNSIESSIPKLIELRNAGIRLLDISDPIEKAILNQGFFDDALRNNINNTEVLAEAFEKYKAVLNDDAFLKETEEWMKKQDAAFKKGDLTRSEYNENLVKKQREINEIILDSDFGNAQERIDIYDYFIKTIVNKSKELTDQIADPYKVATLAIKEYNSEMTNLQTAYDKLADKETLGVEEFEQLQSLARKHNISLGDTVNLSKNYKEILGKIAEAERIARIEQLESERTLLIIQSNKLLGYAAEAKAIEGLSEMEALRAERLMGTGWADSDAEDKLKAITYQIEALKNSAYDFTSSDKGSKKDSDKLELDTLQKLISRKAQLQNEISELEQRISNEGDSDKRIEYYIQAARKTDELAAATRELLVVQEEQYQKEKAILEQYGLIKDNSVLGGKELEAQMEVLNKKYGSTEGAIDKIKNSFQNFVNLGDSEIPGLKKELIDYAEVWKKTAILIEEAKIAKIDFLSARTQGELDIAQEALDEQEKALDRITAQYEYVAEQRMKALDEEIEKINEKYDAENKAYELEIEALRKEKEALDVAREEAKAAQDLLDAETELHNLLKNKDTRQLIDGVFQFVANPRKVREAQEKLAKLREKQEQDAEDAAIDERITEKERLIAENNERREIEIAAYEARKTALQDFLDQMAFRTGEFYGQDLTKFEAELLKLEESTNATSTSFGNTAYIINDLLDAALITLQNEISISKTRVEELTTSLKDFEEQIRKIQETITGITVSSSSNYNSGNVSGGSGGTSMPPRDRNFHQEMIDKKNQGAPVEELLQLAKQRDEKIAAEGLTGLKTSDEILRELGVYHQGGIIGEGNSSSKLINKLFNVKPNEQVVKALKGEIMIPMENISKNFMPNIHSFAEAIKGGNTIYQFNIDKVETPNVDQFIRDMKNRTSLTKKKI